MRAPASPGPPKLSALMPALPGCSGCSSLGDLQDGVVDRPDTANGAVDTPPDDALHVQHLGSDESLDLESSASLRAWVDELAALIHVR